MNQGLSHNTLSPESYLSSPPPIPSYINNARSELQRAILYEIKNCAELNASTPIVWIKQLVTPGSDRQKIRQENNSKNDTFVVANQAFKERFKISSLDLYLTLNDAKNSALPFGCSVLSLLCNDTEFEKLVSQQVENFSSALLQSSYADFNFATATLNEADETEVLTIENVNAVGETLEEEVYLVFNSNRVGDTFFRTIKGQGMI